MPIKYSAVLIVFCCLVAGCSSVSQKERSSKQVRTPDSSIQTDSRGVKGKLYAKYRQWEGVPYQWGGLSRSGIDCSGFVHVVYKRELGKILPRTTELQARAGRHVDINSLKAGDLVFLESVITHGMLEFISRIGGSCMLLGAGVLPFHN